MTEDDGSFVSRWSRLKRQQREDGLADPAVSAEQPVDKPDREPERAGEPDVEELVKSLPDIETMTEESDFTVFLQKGVPQELKQRALRRLWRLNPVFANLDGLAEYDEDFTDAASVVKNLKTLYEVGKGMPAPKKPEEEDEPEAVSSSDGEGSEPVESGESRDRDQEESGAETPEGRPAAESDDSAREELAGQAVEPGESPAEPAPCSPRPRGRAALRRWGGSEG